MTDIFVALSCTETKGVVVALTTKDGLWIKTIIEELYILMLIEIENICICNVSNNSYDYFDLVLIQRLRT